MIHRLAGSPDEVILHDFTLTRVGLEPEREPLLKAMQSLYDKSAWNNPVLLVFWGVHADGMRAFLSALEKNYGGITCYLKNKLGFSNEDVERMKKNLVLQV